MAVATQAEVKSSPLGGRGLFATKNHASGDVLISLDRPLIAVLDNARIEDTCSWCFSWTELPVLSGAGVNQAPKVNWCTGCKKVKYCSKRCQSQAWKTEHKRECKIFAAQPESIPNTVVAVMRMLEGLNTKSDLHKAILDMQTHRDDFEKAGGKKWEAMQLMAHTALKFLGGKESAFKLEPTKMAMCMVMCNSSRLVTPTFDPLGLALDPRTCVINHSCSPSAVIVFDGPKIAVRALKPIQSGEEVLISYVDSSAPFGVRQAELKDQYFFDCTCIKCKLGPNAPQDAFFKPNSEFEERIKVIDDMIPEIVKDPAWPRHVLGETTDDKRLSALQFYAYSFLDSPDAEKATPDPTQFRKPIIICRNTGMWPLTRAPLPALYQQYAVACLSVRKYNEALVALIRLHVLIDPEVYPQAHHPVRVVHAWTLATLAKAVSSDQDSPFCRALQACGVDLSVLFLALLSELHEQVPKSHGLESRFGRMVEATWGAMMESGGELDVQYSQRGVNRSQWQKILNEQIRELRPKIKAFAADESLAAEIDQALAE